MENTHRPRVVVAVDQSFAGFAALRVAVAMARSRRVPLRAVRATAGVGAADEEYIRWAFEEVVGGIPADLKVHLDVSFGSASWMLSRLAPDPRDLIVVANDGRGMIRAAFPARCPAPFSSTRAARCWSCPHRRCTGPHTARPASCKRTAPMSGIGSTRNARSSRAAVHARAPDARMRAAADESGPAGTLVPP